MNNLNDQPGMNFKKPKLENVSDCFEVPPPPKRSKTDSIHRSDVNNNSLRTLTHEETIKETNVVITVNDLKALKCKGMMMCDIDMTKVDCYADQCQLKNLFNPFQSSLIRLIVMADSLACAIVVKGNHRVAAVSKQGLTSDERNVKVFCTLTTVSRRLFKSIWDHAGSLRYTDLEMGNGFNRTPMPDFVMDISIAAAQETISRVDMNSLNSQVQYYMWALGHIYTKDETNEMMTNSVKREAEFEKWFGCGPLTKERRMKKDLLHIFCMPELSKREIVNLLKQGYEFDEPGTISSLLRLATINDSETAKHLNEERGKTRKPATLLRAIRKCL